MKRLKIKNNEEIDINKIITISKAAGKEILKIYEKDFKVMEKKDSSREGGHSALTEADLKSNELINNALKKVYPNIPIISEENSEVPFEERKSWEYFWLVDPLDGTKEFILRNGEFTVNIALIYEGKPVLGVVYAPAKNLLYYGDEKNGSFKKVGMQDPVRLPLKKESSSFVIVASKHHFNKETENFIENLKGEHESIDLLSIGSSLKICMVAEGKADIYPRLGACMEWDTAAAHAVANFSGKKIYELNSNDELKYNKESLLNPWFIVK